LQQQQQQQREREREREEKKKKSCVLWELNYGSSSSTQGFLPWYITILRAIILDSDPPSQEEEWKEGGGREKK
jgi:hypothetical protein